MATGMFYMEIFDLSRLNVQTFLVFCLAFLLAFLYVRRPRNLPPYPAGCWPVLGHLPTLGRAPLGKLTEWRQQYGDVFTIRMGLEDVVILNGYTAVKDALVDRSELFASRAPNYVFDLATGVGKGVVGARWGNAYKQKKRFASTVLKVLCMRKGRSGIEEKVREEAGCLCDKVAEYEGRPFDILQDLQFSIANVVCAMAFGNRFDYGDERFGEFAEAVAVTDARLAAAQVINIFPFLRFVPGVNRAFRDVADCGAKIRNFLRDEIAHHRHNLDHDNPRDFLDFCLVEVDKHDKVENLTQENVLYMHTELFLASVDTVTSTMQWGLVYMVLNPDVQKKVQTEIDAVVGGNLPSLSHRSQLPYTEATVMEVERIRTSTPLAVPHATTQDVKVGPFDVPMGATVMTNLYSLHMDPTYWQDPDRFDPGRFLDAEGKVLNKPPPSFMPFSAGRRVCLGEQVAKMEVFLLFSALLQNFTFKLPEGAEPLSTEGILTITLTPRHHKICAIPR